MPPQHGPPMTLGHMRRLGVRWLAVTCLACHHEADVNMDNQPAQLAVPPFAERMACKRCGSKSVHVMPAWHTKPNQIPHGGRS